MLQVGLSELSHAFSKHRAANATAPNPLLLFYAVECGLKAAWMQRNNCRNTAAINELLSSKGHDLMYWVGELRLSKALAGGPRSFRLRRDASSNDISLSHQAWRYGAEMVQTDENAVLAWLTSLGDWIAKELTA